MFYRRKIVLSFLQPSNNQLDKISLQKLLFLYSRLKKNPEYDFIPYKFGCYSYSLKADLITMVKKGYLQEDNSKYKKVDKNDYFKLLKKTDKPLVKETIERYGNMSNKALTVHTYINYPFYAIKSEIAEELLPEKYLQRIATAQPKQVETALFTIGYEGISLEEYLVKLIKNNVKILIDVRRNPLSMKYGFSKALLKKYCTNLGIEYVHYPEVGIAADQRQNLENQKDYDALFKVYTGTTLKTEMEGQKKIIDQIHRKKRVALTCFEADHCQCHRSHLATSVIKLSNLNQEIIHL